MKKFKWKLCKTQMNENYTSYVYLKKRQTKNVYCVITVSPNALKFGVWYVGTSPNDTIRSFLHFSKFEKLRNIMTSFWRTYVNVTS